MGDKRENMKKTLGIPEYPWSSDDDEILGGLELQTIQQRNEPDGRPSVADNPGTSGRPTLSGTCPPNPAGRESSNQQIWSLPFISTRRSPTLTLRRNRERDDVPLSLVSRPPRSPAATAVDFQRFLAFRKVRQPAGYRPRAASSVPHLPQRHLTFQRSVGVGTSRANRYPVLANPSAAVSNFMMSMRRAAVDRSREIAELDFDNTNNEGAQNKTCPRCKKLFPTYECMMVHMRSHAVMGALNGNNESEAHLNDASSNMQPVNLSHHDDGFLEPDLMHENGLQSADVRIDITMDNDNDAPTEPASASGSGVGGAEAVVVEEGVGRGDPSALSLEEVVEIDAEPEPAATQEPLPAQEPVANTSSANDAVPVIQPHGVKRKRESDDENCELGTVKEFNQSLLRLLECPVCLEWMEPPMWQCRRGHLVCGRCRTRLAACPVCRTAFSSVRNRAMEGVAEMLRYPCRHTCGRDLQLRRRAAHEASCAARRYSCPAPQCASLLAHRDLTQHAQSKHLSLVKLGRTHTFSMRVNSEQHDNWIILALNQLFHLRVDVDIQTWGVVVYVAYIGPKCNADDYTYEVAVTGQHNARKLVYTRSTHCDLECPSLNMSRQDCFHLTLDQALNFLRVKNRHAEPDKYLHFKVEITRNVPTEEHESN